MNAHVCSRSLVVNIIAYYQTLKGDNNNAITKEGGQRTTVGHVRNWATNEGMRC